VALYRDAFGQEAVFEKAPIRQPASLAETFVLVKAGRQY
jgi:hypothetical protein